MTIQPNTPKAFSVAALPEFDNGITAAIIDEAIEACIRDCNDRPHNTKERRASVTFVFTPVVNARDGTCESIDMQAVVSESRPKLKGGANRMDVRYMRGASGKSELKAVFMPGSPANPNQSTMNFFPESESE